jgi:hypothetical protein
MARALQKSKVQVKLLLFSWIVLIFFDFWSGKSAEFAAVEN